MSMGMVGYVFKELWASQWDARNQIEDPPTLRKHYVAQVDNSQRLQHTISWSDESSPTSKAKPGQARALSVALGELAFGGRAVERNGFSDDHGVRSKRRSRSCAAQ
jgi:TnpA family transposase